MDKRQLWWLLLTFNVNAEVSKKEATTLEVIEVTAQKKVESIQQVPISIAAIDGSLIKQMGLTQAQDIAEFVPNLNSARSISGIQNYFIRGIGLDDFNLSSVPAVGIYLDDVAVHNPMLASMTLHDISRVEVLRGPQNTLYGKNTTAGAVKFVSTQPEFDMDLNGFAKFSVGSFNRRYLDVASNVPISQNQSLRLAGFYHLADGQYRSGLAEHNTHYNNVDRVGLGAQYKHKLGDDWLFHAKLFFARQDQITPVKLITYGTSDAPNIDLDNVDFDQIYSPLVAPRDDMTASSGFIRLTKQFDSFNFSSLTAFEQVRSERMDDWGAQNQPAGTFAVITYNSTDTQNLTQEFQLQGQLPNASWLMGIALNKDSGRLTQAAYIDPATQGRPDDQIEDAGGGPLFDRASDQDVDTLTWSLYGNYDHKITKKLGASIGYRYSVQDLSPTVRSAGMMMDDPTAPFPLGTFGWYSLGNPDFDIFTDYAGFEVLDNFYQANGGPGGVAKIDEKFSEWGAKLALDYQLTSSVLFYGSLSRGFKMGAVNSNPATVTFHHLLDNVVSPEVLLTYEAGWKSQWLDNTLRVNGAVFSNSWENYQFFLVYNPGSPDALFASLVNLPEAQSNGLELDINWLLSPTLELTAGVGLLDTEVTNATLDTSGIPETQQTAFQNQVLEGDELTNAPHFVWNAAIAKSIELPQGDLTARLHVDYKSKHAHMLAGDNSAIWLQNFSDNAVTLLNANLGYQFGVDRQYDINLWVKNALDIKYCTERATVPGTNSELVKLCAPGQPLSFGLALSYRFD